MEKENKKYVFVDEKDVKKSDKFSRYKFFIVLFFILGFLGLAAYSYHAQLGNIEEFDLPIISAPERVKFKPGDPGGFVVSNRDKEIYDHMSGKKVTGGKIKTSKSSEAPVPKNEIAALIDKQLQDDKIKAKPVKLYISKNTGIIEKKHYTIRIAKIKNQKVLDKAWEIMSNKYGDLIGKLQPELHTEKHWAKNNYYLHAGPFTSAKSANSICDSFKNRGKSCSVHFKEEK
jgi:hypothetical protein